MARALVHPFQAVGIKSAYGTGETPISARHIYDQLTRYNGELYFPGTVDLISFKTDQLDQGWENPSSRESPGEQFTAGVCDVVDEARDFVLDSDDLTSIGS